MIPLVTQARLVAEIYLKNAMISEFKKPCIFLYNYHFNDSSIRRRWQGFSSICFDGRQVKVVIICRWLAFALLKQVRVNLLKNIIVEYSH